MMKRTIALVLVVAAVILTIFGCASNQQPSAQAHKPGKALVKQLPARIQGVELAGNTVRIKPGFKWVKQPNGTVTVARMAGGGGLGSGGTWSCDCTTGPYSCEGVVEDNSLKCTTRDCLACKLTVKSGGQRHAIIAY